MSCQHKKIITGTKMAHMIDSGRWLAEITITCGDCNQPFQFVGIPMGLNINGAAVSPDGQEIRLAVAPAGSRLNPIEEAMQKAGIKHRLNS